MTTVLDASALLAFLHGEPGADEVESALEVAPRCSAANWSEVAQEVMAAGRDWDLVRALLESYQLEIEAVSVEDAEWAACRWIKGDGLSLADRLCLALAARLEAPVLTADASWGSDGLIRQIR